MITSMMGRMADAEKLSIPQLQQAIKNGTIPAYVGVPMLQDKMKQHQQAMAAQQAQQGQQQQQRPVAEQIMQQAEQQGGINQLPSNLPEDEGYAGGGIIAFADEGQVKDSELNERTNKSEPNALQRWMREHVWFGGSPEAGAPETPPIEKTLPSTAEQPYVMGQTGGGAALPYRRQQGAASAVAPTRDMGIPSVTPEQLALLNTSYKELPPDMAAEARANRMAEYQPGATPLADNTGLAGVGGGAGKGGAGAGGAGAGGAGKAMIPADLREGSAAYAQQAPESALDKYAAMLMEERKGSAAEKEKAKYMAIMQAGLGIAGGTSPNALANIAQGALPATQSYQEAIKGIKKDDRDALKQMMELGVSKEKMQLEAKKLGISEKHFDQIYEVEKAKLGVMGGQRADARTQAEEMKRLTVAQGLFGKLRSDQMMSGKSDDELWANAQRMAGMSTPVETESKNKFAGFSLVK